VNEDPLLGLEETDGLDPTEAVLSLTDRTVRGLFWTYGSVALTVVLQVGYTVVISRRLSPSAFGLVAFAGLPIALSGYFADMGISAAVVQKPELDNRDVRVAFTGSVVAGLLISAIVILVAPAIGVLFGNLKVVPILRVLALSFAIMGFGSVALGLLQREMKFRQIAIIEVTSYALAYPLPGLLLAWRGAGVWSLVGAALMQTVTMVSLSYALTRHAVRPLIDGRRAKRIYGFGGLVSVNGLLEFFGANADTFAVGRFIGTDSLGQYSRANLVIGLPLSHLATGASSVLMPAFARLHGDDARARRAFLRALALFASLMFPMAAVLGVLAKPLVHVLLGNQWGETALVLPIVGGAVAFGFVLHLPAVVCQVRGRLRQKIAIQCAYLVVVVVLVALVVHRGPTLRTLALVFLTGQVLQEVLYLGYIKRDLSLSAADLLVIHGEAFVLAGAAGGGAWVVSTLVSSPLLALLAGGVSGVAIWVAAMLLFKGLRARRAFEELDLRSYLRRLPRRTTRAGG
jgi:O-antigen/teichoic acid export membrane protein